jgi:hypothetical protein
MHMHGVQWTPVAMKIEGQVPDLEIHGARNNSVFFKPTQPHVLRA